MVIAVDEDIKRISCMLNLVFFIKKDDGMLDNTHDDSVKMKFLRGAYFVLLI